MTSLWQHDGAPAHRAREMVELLKEVTPDFIPPSLWPPNSPDLNPVNYAIWGIMQDRVYNKGKIANVEELRQRIVDEWERLISELSTASEAQWRSGENDCERVLLLKEDSLNMNCDSWWNIVVVTVHYDFAV